MLDGTPPEIIYDRGAHVPLFRRRRRSMAENLRLLRLFYLLLALFTIGRLAMTHVPYEKGHQVFSLVPLTALSSIYYAPFTRRFRGYRVLQPVGLGFLLALSAQIVIFSITAVSYPLGVSNSFTNPRALL